MIKYFTNQDLFFTNINLEKYNEFRYNLCGIINIFIILKNLGIDLTEKEIFEKSLEINAYDYRYGWKYLGLVKLMDIYGVKSRIFNLRIFSKFFLKIILRKIKYGRVLFIASIKSIEDENHLIIIENFQNDILFYKSVGTRNSLPIEYGKINLLDFLYIYNKRGIIIYLK